MFYDEYFTLLICSTIFCAVLGWLVGSLNDAGLLGFIMGLMLGPLGVFLVMAFDFRKKCPTCRTRYERELDRCDTCSKLESIALETSSSNDDSRPVVTD